MTKLKKLTKICKSPKGSKLKNVGTKCSFLKVEIVLNEKWHDSIQKYVTFFDIYFIGSCSYFPQIDFLSSNADFYRITKEFFRLM